MTDLRRHISAVALAWDDEAPDRLWQSIDATLVFADISGFTALTERLSARGRIGAEQIVETLNGIFGSMLYGAAGRGGDLLKFGGDALFFLFRGDDHVRRGCEAAVEMRSTLRCAEVAADVGRLRLSMSVGIHSGEVLLLLVGSPTRELLVLGPAATAVTLAEKVAQAGQIVVTEATARRLPARFTRRQGEVILLTRRTTGTPDPGPKSADSVPRQRLATLFPHDLGEYLDPGIPDPEHRNACIGFVKFSGTDDLLAHSGPDAVAAATHQLVSVLEEVLAPEGVTLLATDLDADGGKFFLASGVPRAAEDDGGRMLRAMGALVRRQLPLPIQVGVNRGHVFAAEVGVGFRAAYSAMGDTTNTAARLMGKAPPGGILAAPAVLEHARSSFEASPAGPFAMKGKTVPMLAYEIGSQLGHRESATVADLPLLGRDREVALLRAAISAAQAGKGGTLTVSGPAGIGKSRVVAEALRGTPLRLLSLRGEPNAVSIAYRIFRYPIRALLGLSPGSPQDMGQQLLARLAAVDPELVPLAPLLAELMQVEVPPTPQVDAIDPQYRPERLATALVTLLEQLLPGPLVILVEDATWVDGASAHLLGRLAANTTTHPWVQIALRRSDGAGYEPAAGVQLALGPLPAEVLRDLVIAASEATPLRSHEIEAIVDRANGSPLYVVEVMRTAVGGNSMAALPESVHAALAAQIDQLHPQTRRVLRYCAVLGRSFSRDVLRAVLTVDGAAVDQATIQDLGQFIEEDGPDRYKFRNSLVRDAAYDGLAFRVRARLHGVAGRSLERLSTNLDGHAAILSLHFFEAGDFRTSWEYGRRAGDLAARSYANVDAAAQYERAFEAARRAPDVGAAECASLLSALGQVRELAGVLDGSIDSYRRAARFAADPVARAEIMARRARVESRTGSAQTALRTIGAARRALRNSPGEECLRVEVRLEYLMTLVRIGQEKFTDAQRWAARAVESARSIGDTDTLVSALLSADYVDQQLGRSGIGDHTREALRISSEVGDLRGQSIARANLGVLAFYAGRWPEAIDWLSSSSRAAVEAGNDFGAAETDLTFAEILIYQGRLGEAEAVLSRASRVLRASGIEAYATQAVMLQARIHLSRGQLSLAEEHAEAAAAAFLEIGSRVDALEAVLLKSEAAIEAGRPAEALRLVHEAQQAAQGEGAWLEARVRLVQARALLHLDRLDETAGAIRVGLESAREQGLPFEEAMLLRVRGQWCSRVQAGHRSSSVQVDLAEADRLLAALGAKV